MTALRIWLIGSAVLLTVIALWALAPVVFFLLLLAAALGLVSALMIALARFLQAWRERGQPSADRDARD
ncbi:MAG: hypothetical protein F9K29_22630 [Hyphomicrobiaceae bacterium]|nr:MAG: hypothetical protein F9K29_22630 [Hyphomicrobiaceae bacterium]